MDLLDRAASLCFPMKRTAVLNVVGLTAGLIGRHTPRLAQLAARGILARIRPAFPAVTCTAQSNYLTGQPPARHGVVGNGWYDRELAEVLFWKQCNRLVHGEKVWERLRRRAPQFTCAKLFWWFNMYSSVDYSITPRPMYPADGRKVFDIYTWPPAIRTEIKEDLGEFPFASFWGPAAGRPTPRGSADAATRWIAESAMWIERKHQPTLSLVYLPHLDYNLQRHGPFSPIRTVQPSDVLARSLPPGETSPADSRANCGLPSPTDLNPAILSDLRETDAIVGGLLDFFDSRGVQVVLLSEYGLTNVDTPVHVNRLFRRQGWLAVREELGRELLDAGASKVFAVADHQVAHIYLNDPSLAGAVRELLEANESVANVLGTGEKTAAGIDHPRAGDLVAVTRDNAWFTYYYWLDDARAPDFARTVDIHRKPGYDPVELFLHPGLKFPRLKIAGRLLQKRLGFRMLMDVVPLEAELVKGSHGCRPTNPEDWPVFLGPRRDLLPGAVLDSLDVLPVLERHLLA